MLNEQFMVPLKISDFQKNSKFISENRSMLLQHCKNYINANLNHFSLTSVHVLIYSTDKEKK